MSLQCHGVIVLSIKRRDKPLDWGIRYIFLQVGFDWTHFESAFIMTVTDSPVVPIVRCSIFDRIIKLIVTGDGEGYICGIDDSPMEK